MGPVARLSAFAVCVPNSRLGSLSLEKALARACCESAGFLHLCRNLCRSLSRKMPDPTNVATKAADKVFSSADFCNRLYLIINAPSEHHLRPQQHFVEFIVTGSRICTTELRASVNAQLSFVRAAK